MDRDRRCYSWDLLAIYIHIYIYSIYTHAVIYTYIHTWVGSPYFNIIFTRNLVQFSETEYVISMDMSALYLHSALVLWFLSGFRVRLRLSQVSQLSVQPKKTAFILRLEGVQPHFQLLLALFQLFNLLTESLLRTLAICYS